MSIWSRRSFLASAGTLATAGGAGATAAARADTAEIPLLSTYVDARAIAVLTRDGAKLGYIPRVQNQAVANLMDAGLTPRAAVASARTDTSRPDIRIEVSLPMA